MSKLIIELQKECLNPKISLTDLLRKARFIAQKLNIKDMVEYCSNELEGYTKGPVPEYRKTLVTYKAFNPYRGWIPVSLPSTLSYMLNRSLFLSVGEMEDFLKKEDLTMSMSADSKLQESLRDPFGSPIQLEVKCFFPKTQFTRILDTIRNKISDWAIELEQKGILGDEYEFSKEEREKVQSMSITNIFNAPINGANIVGNMTNSSAIIHNDSFDFKALKQLVSKIEADLENAKNIESEKVAALKEQVTSLKQSIEEKNETSAMDLLKQLAVGAASSGIWSIGSTITNFLSSLV